MMLSKADLEELFPELFPAAKVDQPETAAAAARYRPAAPGRSLKVAGIQAPRVDADPEGILQREVA